MYDTEKYLRLLAKTNKYQILYNNAKEIGIQIFDNKSDLTDVQLRFLNCLSFYNILYTDYALGEIEFIVFDNNIYEDAYHYYKNKQRTKDKTAKTDNTSLHKISDRNISQSQEYSWVFKKPAKRVM